MSLALSCCVIGETGVFLACLEMLIKSSIEIKFIVTQESSAVALAKRHDIPYFSCIDHSKAILEKGVDYLFSIANPHILSENELSCACRLAVNYHDSPLPRYAGSYATSWAILNDEPEHGITWHVMDAKVDSGDILIQEIFPIVPGESAASLSIKCLSYSTKAFSKLLDLLETDHMPRIKQSLQQRSFYPKNKPLPNGGVIQWDVGAKEIDCLIRALNLGQKENTFSLPRLIFEARVYFPLASSYVSSANESTSCPGEVLEIRSDSIKIATQSGILLISELLDFLGKSIDFLEFAKRHQLSVGSILPGSDPSSSADYCWKYESAKRDEKYWVQEFSKINPLGVPWLLDSSTKASILIQERVRVPEAIASKLISSFEIKIQMLALLLISLQRITPQPRFSVALIKGSQINSPIFIEKILNLDLQPSMVFDEFCLNMQKKITEIIEKSAPLADLCVRYQKEAAQLPVQVVMGDSASYQHFDDDVFLQIFLSKDCLEFRTRCTQSNKKDFFSFFANYCSELENLAELSRAKFSEQPLVSIAEEKELDSFNSLSSVGNPQICIHKLFKSQVEKTPDAIAVSFMGTYLSYEELDKLSSSVALRLQALISFSKEKQEIVGILSDRSLEMIVSMLGCLKAGFAYLPIDSNYPVERVQHIFSDADVKVVISRLNLLKNLHPTIQPILMEEICHFTDRGDLASFSPKFMCYVLYTSGSTGLPKGAGLAHYSVTNLLLWYTKEFCIEKEDNILIFTAFGFDLTQKNILGGLISGSKICLFPNTNFNPHGIIELVERECVTFINCPPSAFYSIAEYCEEKNTVPSLRICLLGGEAIQPGKVSRFFNSHQCKIINTYGPTECSDLSLTHDLSKDDLEDGSTIPLGKNVGNVSIYILNSNLQRVPVGCIGEIYLSGISLGLGYIGKPDLTAKIFIANPFIPGQRLYKTCDWGRYLPDGKVEFCGRIDHQVKVRGFRIELEEIDFAISEHDDVQQCITILREDITDQKKVVSYIIPYEKNLPNKDLLIQQVRDKCSRMLPSFMVPSQFVVLQEFSLTANGKVDRKKLPIPGKKEWAISYEKPIGGFETVVAGLWSEILGMEQVGRNDNFFNLGGDSILAIRFIADLQEAGYFLDLNDLYVHKCISQLPQTQTLQHQHTHYVPFSLIEKKDFRVTLQGDQNLSDAYPASSMQKGMLIESAKDSSLYHDIFSYRIHKLLDYDFFASIIASIVEKHPVLRTSILEDENHGFTVLEHSSVKNTEKLFLEASQDVNERVLQELKDPIALDSPGLFRIIILNTGQSHFDLIFSFSHIVMDGWSLNLLISEVVSLYTRKKALLNSTSLFFGEFVQSEIQALSSERYISHYQKMLDQFSFSPTLSIAKELPSKLVPSEISGTVGRETSATILSVSKNLGTTPDILFTAAYIYSLSKVGGKNDIVFGTIINNRLPKQGGDRQLGLFLNTKLLRAKLPTSHSGLCPVEILEFVRDLLSRSLFSNPFPYQEVLSKLSLDKEILSYCFNYVHFARNLELEKKGLITPGPFYERTDIPCTFNVIRKTDTFDISLRINSSQLVFQSIYEYIWQFLEALSEPMALIPPLTNKDQSYLDNVTKLGASYSVQECLHELFEKELLKHPDAIAACFKQSTISYHELQERAESLAQILLSKYQVFPEECVAICMERSDDLIVAILGVLKAGCCFVPISPDIPQQRLKYILQDTAARVTVVDSAALEKVKSYQLGDQKLHLITKHLPSKKILLPKVSVDQLAYVIYTSGSSGSPKGVAISHKSAVNYIANLQNESIILEGNSVDFSTQASFDLSITTLLGPLCLGAKIEVFDGKIDDLNAYKKHLSQKQIEVVKQVTSFLPALQQILDNSWVKTLLLGGEKFNASLLDSTVLTKILVYDEYGPTETTVGASLVKVSPFPSVPRFALYQNYQIYILDEQLDPLPYGSVGQVCIGGIGLARGYFGKAGLTSEKFVANPFDNGALLYLTGDLARFSSNGCLEYFGRIDNQVKLRSYRVELGEIEFQVRQLKQVDDAIVVIKNSGTKSQTLVCYYTGINLNGSSHLEEHLQKSLPGYMIPQVFIFLTSLPRTASGKIDRSFLENQTDLSPALWIAPRNQLEEDLCKIFRDVLSLEKVGPCEDFFRLGGDSISSILVVGQIRQKLGLKLTIKDIFEQRTVENILSRIEEEPLTSPIPRENEILKGNFELLPIQAWFFNQKFANPSFWNQSFLVRVPELDTHRLEKAFYQLVLFHDSFRLCFKGTKQFYFENIEIPKLKVGMFSDKLDQMLVDWQSNFNLEKGPLFSFGYISGFPDGSARIFIAAHHLILDAVSWRILFQDLKSLYDGALLKNKGSSYRAWVHAVRNFVPDEREKKYWKNVKIQDPKFTFVDSISRSSIELNEEITKELLTTVHSLYNTEMNDILLTTLGLSIKDVFGISEITIAIETHGRIPFERNLDVSQTVGWFTAFYPIYLDSNGSLKEILINTKERIRSVPNNGIGYGSQFGYEVLPQIYLNYLGKVDEFEQGNWRLTGEDSGSILERGKGRSCRVGFEGRVIEGKLQFSVHGPLSQNNTQQLADSFAKHLMQIVKLSREENRSYLTESDIGNILSQQHLDTIQQSKEVEAVYRANSLQQGFIYHFINQGDFDDAYYVQLVWKYDREINHHLMKKAWEAAISQFGALRLRFDWFQDLVQIIDKNADLDFRFIDLSLEDQTQNLDIRKIQERDRQEPFHLRKGKLWRIYLIKEEENSYFSILSNHHSILDGWSRPLLLSFVHQTYLNYLHGKKRSYLPKDCYSDVQKHLQKKSSGFSLSDPKAFSPIEERPDLSSLQVNPHDDMSSFHHVKIPSQESRHIGRSTYEKLKSFCIKEGITVNALTQFVWHRVLHVFGSSHTTVSGLTISGRNIPINRIEEGIGLFINTLPLVFEHVPSESIISALHRIQNAIHKINEQVATNLGEITREGKRLFDSIVIFENYPKPEIQSELKFREIYAVEKLDYPLGVIVQETWKGLSIAIEYPSEFILKDAVLQVLDFIEDQFSQIIQSIGVVGRLDNALVHQNWNQDPSPFPSDKTLHELFELQARESPDATAIRYLDKVLTYNELSLESDRVAQLLSSKGIGFEDTVGLYLERSEKMILLILGILKCGAAYVPIDRASPNARVKCILETASAKCILTDDPEARFSVPTEYIPKFLDEPVIQTFVEKKLDSCQKLAYIAFTSGSTGSPKGVMVSHQSVVNRVHWMNQQFPMERGDCVLQKTPYFFDVSVWELFWPILYGGTICFLKPGAHTNPSEIHDRIRRELITHIHFVPSMISPFFDGFETKKIETLKFFFLSGEALATDHVDQIHKYVPNVECVNLYGPTETTIDSTYSLVNRSTQISIGFPIANTKTYVLDKQLNEVPTNVVGELFIGGVGLARGYLEMPEKTSENFLANPFEVGSRFYRTGDLVRRNKDGKIEYVGRADHQVKIHGMRVELGEIEQSMLSIEGVIQAVVVFKKHQKTQEQILVGYLVLKRGYRKDFVLERLAKILPAYMIPNYLIEMEMLPLSPSGKVNRSALPQIIDESQEKFVPPKNDLEKQILNVWKGLLKLDEISTNAEFWKLGGSSLLSIKMVNELKKDLEVFSLKPIDLFAFPTIEMLAEHIQNQSGQQVLEEGEI